MSIARVYRPDVSIERVDRPSVSTERVDRPNVPTVCVDRPNVSIVRVDRPNVSIGRRVTMPDVSLDPRKNIGPADALKRRHQTKTGISYGNSHLAFE